MTHVEHGIHIPPPKSSKKQMGEETFNLASNIAPLINLPSKHLKHTKRGDLTTTQIYPQI